MCVRHTGVPEAWGRRTTGLIKQFLMDVDWGALDYLIVDTPPGTSDEHLTITQLLKQAGVSGAIIVTTPQVCVRAGPSSRSGHAR